jgi:hypothetical protein
MCGIEEEVEICATNITNKTKCFLFSRILDNGKSLKTQ